MVVTPKKIKKKHVIGGQTIEADLTPDEEKQVARAAGFDRPGGLTGASPNAQAFINARNNALKENLVRSDLKEQSFIKDVQSKVAAEELQQKQQENQPLLDQIGQLPTPQVQTLPQGGTFTSADAENIDALAGKTGAIDVKGLATTALASGVAGAGAGAAAGAVVGGVGAIPGAIAGFIGGAGTGLIGKITSDKRQDTKTAFRQFNEATANMKTIIDGVNSGTISPDQAVVLWNRQLVRINGSERWMKENTRTKLGESLSGANEELVEVEAFRDVQPLLEQQFRIALLQPNPAAMPISQGQTTTEVAQ